MSHVADRKPKFGDRLRNTAAGESNPHRDAYFIRVVKVTGRLNPGTHYEMTDGNGATWLQSPRYLEFLDAAAPECAQGAVTPNHAACCAEGGGSISGCCCVKPDHVRIPSPSFEEWFGAIWAGSDKIPVPEWQSAGWNEYVAQRALALGAWETSWAAALATQPQPQDAARDREDAERYRCLRSTRVNPHAVLPCGDELDAYIDAARGAGWGG